MTHFEGVDFYEKFTLFSHGFHPSIKSDGNIMLEDQVDVVWRIVEISEPDTRSVFSSGIVGRIA